MTGSPSPLRSRSNGPRGARSVSGCLTCRRRRVKCKMRNTPCDNCQHLNLACAPSFHHNFKNWTPITAQRPQIRVPKDVSDPELATNVNLEELESGMTETPLEATDTTREALPQDVLLWLSSGFNNDEFNLALPSPGQNFESRVPIEADYDLHSDYVDDWTLPPSSSPFQHEFNASHNVSRYHDKATCITTTTVRSQAPSNAASVAAPTSSGSRCGLDGLDSFLSSTFSCNSSSMLDIPPQIAQVYGNSHGGMPLLSQYENEMPKLLTAKASPWNPFNYMLNSTRDSPSSPLRHGILSWTCCYLSCRNQNHAYSGTAYYVFASNAIQNIVSELATCWSQEYSTMKSPKRSEMMYMLLSTAYFLSQCDIMLCDYQSLYDRLDSIKELLQQHWNKLKPSLSTLDRRLLTWLAYLDLRCSLFGNHKLRRTGNSKQYKDLISILIDLGALSSLRSVSGGQSYLSECYGDSYPETELQEDLAQEPCHMKCDDVLSIFSSLNSFESWNEEHPPQSGDSIIEELRNAKIQALRANLSRIRAVSALSVLYHEDGCLTFR
jgi:hypothetical protein